MGTVRSSHLLLLFWHHHILQLTNKHDIGTYIIYVVCILHNVKGHYINCIFIKKNLLCEVLVYNAKWSTTYFTWTLYSGKDQIKVVIFHFWRRILLRDLLIVLLKPSYQNWRKMYVFRTNFFLTKTFKFGVNFHKLIEVNYS